MKKILICILFCLAVFISCNKQQEMKYNETINLIKDCYSKVNLNENDRDTKDFWLWNKKTTNCSKCNQLLLRNIEFIHNYIGNDSVEEEKVTVETCKNEKCKYFAVYQIPLHKEFPHEEENNEIKPICLYKGKYINLDDVLLEEKIIKAQGEQEKEEVINE